MGAAPQRIAVLGGDGIGPAVVEEALKVLDALRAPFALGLEVERLPWGAERYLADGTTLPAGEVARLRAEVDAILFGALGDPRIPDMRHGRAILLALRCELDLYVNARPVRPLAEHLCPLKRVPAAAIDLLVVRENTEGPYVNVGGHFRRGTADEVAINEDINSRRGVERLVRAGFEAARARPRRRITLADKSNAMPFAHDLWRRVFAEVAAAYPDVEATASYVDAVAMDMVRAPHAFSVIVTNNLFGDILSDLGAQLQGGLGMAPSANVHPAPGGRHPPLFEPVHGSAPDLVGTDRANPIAAILSLQLLLAELGHPAAAAAVGAGVAAAVAAGALTDDVGGRLGTRAVGDFVARQVAAC